MQPTYTAHGRPNWYKDAKWIAAILLLLVLGPALFLYNLVEITAEKPAVDTVSTALAVAFSPRGLDDPSEIDQLRQLVRSAPGGTVQPIPGLSLTVRAQDLEGLPPRQVRINLFRQLGEPFYQKGDLGATGLVENSQLQGEIGTVFAPLGLFTAPTHQRLRQDAAVLAAASLLLLLPLLYFSSGFGRLGSPGLVLALASIPGALLSAAAWNALQGYATAASSAQPTDLPSMVAAAAGMALPPLLRMVADNYRWWLEVGLGLAALAVVGDLMLRALGQVSRRGRRKSTAQP